MNTIKGKYIAILISSFALIGCNSSDSSDSDTIDVSNDNVETGIFVDSTVSGLAYETDTMSGITNADGEFHYAEGEMVEFSIGDIMFGQAMGQSVLTPLDLVPDATNVSHPTVSNMVRLMLTLDSDGDPNNGIMISEQVRSQAMGHTFHFDVPESEFESNLEILTFIGQSSNTSNMMDADTARSHFQETLDSMGHGM